MIVFHFESFIKPCVHICFSTTWFFFLDILNKLWASLLVGCDNFFFTCMQYNHFLLSTNHFCFFFNWGTFRNSVMYDTHLVFFMALFVSVLYCTIDANILHDVRCSHYLDFQWRCLQCCKPKTCYLWFWLIHHL